MGIKGKFLKGSTEAQTIAINLYLFLVALYLLLASAHLTNALVNFTVEGNIGTYFKFIDASVDRAILYALNFVTVFYVTLKLPKILSVLLLANVIAGYLVFMQIADVFSILVSFFALVWLLTNPQPFPTTRRNRAASLVVVYLLLILILVETAALACRFAFPFNPELNRDGTCRYLVDLETKMYLLAGSLAPALAVIFLFSWTAKPFLSCDKSLRKSLSHTRTSFTQSNGSSNNACLRRHFPLILLACTIILSFLVALYPYAPKLNVDMHPIGVDLPFYERWLAESANVDFFSVATGCFFECRDRPLSLLILYLTRHASGLTALTIVQFSLVVVFPVLVLSVYFFMREADFSGCTPLLAAFLSVSSFYVTVGMFAFFLSNLMALIELYLVMGFYFSSLRKKSYSRMAVAVLFSISLLFTHSWTWGMAICVFVICLLSTIISKRKGMSECRFEVQSLTILVLTNIFVNIIRNYALGLSAGYFEPSIIAESTVSIGALGSFWNDLLHTFVQQMYGFFVNPMALLLGVLGGLSAVSGDKPVNRYLTSWLLASSAFFVLCSGWTIKSRILFNVPLPVFQSLGLTAISRIIGKIFEQTIAPSLKLSIVLLALLVGLNYAFRCAFLMLQV